MTSEAKRIPWWLGPLLMAAGAMWVTLTGCAAFEEVATGAAIGVGAAAPAALEDLVSGNWVNALITLGVGAIAGGGGWLGLKKLRKKKRGGGRRGG